jgi:transcriptional regulator with XRE-family HTH domain
VYKKPIDLIDQIETQADIDFGQYLARERIRCGFSFKEVGSRTGISASRWRCLERGNVRIGIRKKEIERIAKALDLSIHEVNRAVTSAMQDSVRVLSPPCPPEDSHIDYKTTG